MKLKSLFMAILAGAAVFASCQGENNPGDTKASVKVIPDVLAFEKGGDNLSSAVTVEATRAWTATSPSWITLSQTSGESGTVMVIITAEPNASYDRIGEVTFSVSGATPAIVAVRQAGELGTYEAKEGNGTKESPYTVSQAMELVKDFKWVSNDDCDVTDFVYVIGKISSIKEAYSSQYGNANFTISDDGTVSGAQLRAYRVLYLSNAKWQDGNTQIKQDDIAVIYGKLMYYGTGEEGKTRELETVQSGSYLYSLNGETQPSGAIIPDFSNAQEITVAELIAKGDETNYYKVTGEVSSYNAQYGSFDLTDATGTVYVYNTKNISDYKLANGDKVKVAGKYKLYKKEGQADKNELLDVYILNHERGAVGTAEGDGSLANPFSAEAAYQVAIELGSNGTSTQDYYIKGKISSIQYTFSQQYGTATFNISENGEKSGTTQFTCYSILYLNNRKWVEGDTQIKLGDEIIACGKITNYQGIPETKSQAAYIYSLNGVTDGGEVVPSITITEFVQNKTGFSLSYTSNISEGTFSYNIYAGSTNSAAVKSGDFSGTSASIEFAAVPGTTYYAVVSNGTVKSDAASLVAVDNTDVANTVEFDFTAKGYTNQQEITSVTEGGVTIAFDKGTNRNTPKFYTSGNAIRVYGGGTITVSSQKKVLAVNFTFGPSDGTNEITADSGTWESPKWTGSAESVVFTIGGTSGNRRIQKMVVTTE